MKLFYDLVLRSALLRASRRTAAGKVVPASILRDAVLRTAPQDEVCGVDSPLSDLIGFMESIELARIPASAGRMAVDATLDQILSGQRRVSSNASPVSSRLFRLDRMAGQPLDTPSMSFELSRSISWVSVNLTLSPSCSISKVARE